MADSIDSELSSLLNKLNRIQKDIGGGKKDKSFAVEHGGRLDRFIEVYNRMNDRLEAVKNALDEVRKLEKIAGSNPKELITNQSIVRTELVTLSEEWKELDTLYRLESKKKRSRFTPDELQVRGQMVIQLQQMIQNLKDLQRQGFVKGYQGQRMTTMEDSEMFKKRDIESGMVVDSKGTVANSASQAKGVIGVKNNNMTDLHRQQLVLIRDRDAKIDQEIEEIGKGVDELRELALLANEEIKIQNRMLDTLEEKVNDVHDNVLNINEKMKITIEKARKADKICMDMLCVIILVGLIIVLVKINSAAKS